MKLIKVNNYLASSKGGVVSHTVVQQLGGGGGCGQQEGQARKRLSQTGD